MAGSKAPATIEHQQHRGNFKLSTDIWAVALALTFALFVALGFVPKVPW